MARRERGEDLNSVKKMGPPPRRMATPINEPMSPIDRDSMTDETQHPGEPADPAGLMPRNRR
jgi:hypothetical protein